MSTKYRRRTPEAERVYRSSPALVQQQFPRLNAQRRHRASTGTPALAKQSTLTQIDFITPSAQQRRDFIEIKDSQDESSGSDGEYEDNPRGNKRRRVSGKEKKLGLPKQNTLTQMDFVKGFKDDYLDNEELAEFLGIQKDNLGEQALDNATSKIDFAVPNEPLDEESTPDLPEQLPGSRQPREEISRLPQELPKTPHHSKWANIWEVPSSQTPDATPITISSTRSIRDIQEQVAHSPTPVRTASRIRWADEEQNDIAEDQKHTPIAIERIPQTVDNPLVLEHSQRGSPQQVPRRMLFQSQTSQNPCDQTQDQEPTQLPHEPAAYSFLPVSQLDIYTQNETQISQATRKRIVAFNSEWATIQGRRIGSFQQAMMPPPPRFKQLRGASNQNPSHGHAIGVDTQLEFMQDDMDGPEDETQAVPKPANRSFEIPLDHEIAELSPIEEDQASRPLIILSSQDDEQDLTQSQTQGPSQPPNSTVIPPATTLPPPVRSHRYSSPIPASQASTVPCTPKSSRIVHHEEDEGDELIEEEHSLVLVEATPEKSASLPERYDLGDETIGESQFRRMPGISQLLPSSVFNSDVPLPPEMDSYE